MYFSKLIRLRASRDETDFVSVCSNSQQLLARRFHVDHAIQYDVHAPVGEVHHFQRHVRDDLA